MYCAHCRNKLDPLNTWKGAGGDLFCSEFCAEADTVINPSLVPTPPRLPHINYAGRQQTAQKAA
jgi:hypothetical protein